MKINSEQEMLDLGKKIANYITGRVTTAEWVPKNCLPILGEDSSRQDPSGTIVIELIGDVGSGKTTLTRGLAKELGAKEPVTSPSFTISKSYVLPNNKRLIHYDFYRLPDPGLMADDLAENLANPNNIVVIEWGGPTTALLPKDHITVRIEYDEAGGRTVNFSPKFVL